MKPAKASTHSVPYSYLSSRWSSSADCQELTSCLAPSRMHFKNMESSSPVSSSVPPNHLVVEFRLKNGLCHSCGARIYHIEEESGRVIPLTIPGVSLEGRCLFCYPDETRCKKRRRVDLETSLPPVIKCEPVEDYSSSHVARLPAHANLSNDHEEILVGEFDAAQPSYEISIQDADQNKYTGVVSEGTAKKGTGLFRFVCKKGEFKGKESIFEGGFENGRMEGKGTIRDASGCVYVGSFHLGAAHGSGVCTWAQGWKYEGDWVMDQREGRGKLQQDAENGEVYEGEWKKDQWHGKGELKFNGGGRYVGDFRNHKLEGQGRVSCHDIPLIYVCLCT